MLIDTATRLVGIIGNPLKQSLSPVMQNSTLQKMGLNYVYLPFVIEPDQLESTIKAVRVLDIAGLNVTIPYKQMIIPWLDNLSEEARMCGAVNVIKNINGKITGYNTDGKGFLASLHEQEIPVKGKAVFIGAGGAARSVAYSLGANGIEHIDFLDIDKKQAAETAAWIKQKGFSSNGLLMNSDNFAQLSRDADFIINASPIGMHPGIDVSPVADLDQVKKDCTVCDLIYNPYTTRFLKMAEQLGLKTVKGLSMFVHQGALTLEIWTGIKPPLNFMKEAALNALK